MLIGFLETLRRYQVPVSIKELLTLHEVLEKRLVFADIEDFYLLSRTVMVKDERHFDKFDRAFGAYFKDIESWDDLLDALIPEEWLRAQFLRELSDEDKARIESLGGLDKLIETFKKRLEEQKEQHHGGNKWIGTGGTSPFGHSGYHPEGIRIGGESRNKRAVKVWEKREFKNLDDSVELGTRNIKMALRRLRKFAREGANEELDLDDTIKSTARNAGYLDLKMVPERHNAVKVLLFFDVGGSMDPFVETCEQLFSAARTEFKHLEYFYFHNFIYDAVWKDNHRRSSEVIPTWDILHTYNDDYRVIFVGDASMAVYEITSPGGSVEFFNDEAGAQWMERITQKFSNVAWLNPVPEQYWGYTPSIDITRKLVEDRMYPLTLSGLEAAMQDLSK